MGEIGIVSVYCEKRQVFSNNYHFLLALSAGIGYTLHRESEVFTFRRY